MNKNFLIILLLFITHLFSLDASSARIRNRQLAMNDQTQEANTQPENLYNIQLFDHMNAAYASRFDNQSKVQFINSILDQTEITIEDQIKQVQTLQKIIHNDISSRSGWLWNDAEQQPQIDWLEDQKIKVTRKLADLEWKAKSFGYKTTVQAAKWSSIYLGIILAAYLSQKQLGYDYSYGELAWMPLENLMRLAMNASIVTKNAVVATVPLVQSAILSGAAAATTAGEYAAEAATTIAQKSSEALKTGINQTAQIIQTATADAPMIEPSDTSIITTAASSTSSLSSLWESLKDWLFGN